jgi:hypothetical protein
MKAQALGDEWLLRDANEREAEMRGEARLSFALYFVCLFFLPARLRAESTGGWCGVWHGVAAL